MNMQKPFVDVRIRAMPRELRHKIRVVAAQRELTINQTILLLLEAGLASVQAQAS